MNLLKKMKKYTLVSVLCILVMFTNYAQNNTTIVGKITAFKNTPLNKVLVFSKHAKTSVFSDSLGVFSIDVAKKDVLTFKAEGFQEFTMKTKSIEEPLKVKMIYNANSDAYNAVINANHIPRELLDYAVEFEMGDNNDYANMSSIYDIIQRIYPAAKMIRENGRTQIILNSRGDNSVYAKNDALLVVDGNVVDDIGGIRPIQVYSILVLVGNEAGHWGSRGSGGVIEVTLKQGEL